MEPSEIRKNFNFESPKKNIEPKSPDEVNGKIDCDFRQNLPGDCALLGTIYSLSRTKEGAQAIEDALCVVRDDEDEIIEYKVTFEGTGETYTVTQDELEKAKSPDKNGRQYATGDDDVTVLELAFEKCFTESDDEKLRYLVDNYHNAKVEDMLYGVNPASVSYLLTGEAIEALKATDSTNGPGGHFTPVKNIEIVNTDGETVTYSSGAIYKNGTNAEKTIIVSTNMTDGSKITVPYDTFVNEVLNENGVHSADRAKELFDNYQKNPGSNVLVFGAPPNATVEDVDGNKVTLTMDEAHAYIVEKVGDNSVVLLNSSAPMSGGITVKKDSLFELTNYWVYGSENTDIAPSQDEIDFAAAIEKESATYCPNIATFVISKLGAFLGF